MKNINLVQKDDYNKIVINIGSRCGKGKSTILYLIKQMLDEYGFTVEFDGGLDHTTEKMFDGFALQINKDGSPRHLLYVPANTEIIQYKHNN